MGEGGLAPLVESQSGADEHSDSQDPLGDFSADEQGVDDELGGTDGMDLGSSGLAGDNYHLNDEDADISPGLSSYPHQSTCANAIWFGDTTDIENVQHSNLKISCQFIQALKDASLDSSPLERKTIERLRHCPESPGDLNDRCLRLSLRMLLNHGTAAQDTYNKNIQSLQQELVVTGELDPANLLSYDNACKKMASLTGVSSLETDMCPETCLAFTGPFAELNECPECGSPRYHKKGRGRKRPLRVFHTIPIGPLLQALWSSEESAKRMKYRAEETQRLFASLSKNGGRIPVYEDYIHGADYIKAAKNIDDHDTVLLLSIDGAQLYASKQSDCWIYIWVIMDLSPDLRYKKSHVLPGGFIPGPNKPKNIDSFLFPGLQHISALQKEGLSIWDASVKRRFSSRPFIVMATADGPGIVYLNGLVGHTGAIGCRLYCPVTGRRKEGGHYYPTLLKPDNYSIEFCDHADVDPTSLKCLNYNENLAILMAVRNEAEYRKVRLATGISRPSIFSGLTRIIGIPGCFPGDIMHLLCINVPDFMVKLFRGLITCEKTDDKADWDWAVLSDSVVWEKHGGLIGSATPYLPGSFDKAPRNPAEKISSGYKAKEYLMYTFGLAPAILRGTLPHQYWRNFCLLTSAVRLVLQRQITREQAIDIQNRIVAFVLEFEKLYCKRRADRMHFVRPCLHSLVHLGTEIVRLGPPCIYTQYTMERTIGILGEMVAQHSKPYETLANRGIHLSQTNALTATFPELSPGSTASPQGSIDAGGGYFLLPKRDKNPQPLRDVEVEALQSFFAAAGRSIQLPVSPRVFRWSRLSLPNGQIARSLLKEGKALKGIRIARNVKVYLTSPWKSQHIDHFHTVTSSLLTIGLNLERSNTSSA